MRRETARYPRHTYLDESWFLASEHGELVLVGPLDDARSRWPRPPPFSMAGSLDGGRRTLIIRSVQRQPLANGAAKVLFPPSSGVPGDARRAVWVPDGRVRWVRGLDRTLRSAGRPVIRGRRDQRR